MINAHGEPVYRGWWRCVVLRVAFLAPLGEHQAVGRGQCADRWQPERLRHSPLSIV